MSKQGNGTLPMKAADCHICSSKRLLVAILTYSAFLSSFQLKYFRLDVSMTTTTQEEVVVTPREQAHRRGISFQLHRANPGDNPLRNAIMGGAYRCNAVLPNSSRIKRNRSLPPVLQEHGLFNFATSVHTSLNILFIGDSVAQQFSEAMDESLGILSSWTRTKPNETILEDVGHRKRLSTTSNRSTQEVLSISSPANGGGLSAYWRMTDIWTDSNKGNPLPPSPLGGWNDDQSKLLLDELNRMTMQPRDKFDAVILMYNSWIMPVDPGVEARYLDAIRLARRTIGADAVIIFTYPSTRRVNSTNWKKIQDTNQMLRRISAENNKFIGRGDNGTNHPVSLVLEFGNLTNQLLWSFAWSFGMKVSNPRNISSKPGWELLDNKEILFQRMSNCVKDGCYHMARICHVHAGKKSDCNRNFFSLDDTHWCTETLGARVSAGMACLLGCAFNKCADRGGRSPESMAACEYRCNDQYMALNPVTGNMLRSTSVARSC